MKKKCLYIFFLLFIHVESFSDSLWSTADGPQIEAHQDTNAVELGVKFRSDTSGYIRGIRFYKGSAITGSYRGRLWNNSGVLLASADFQISNTPGWKEVLFSNPVFISANTSYVASYHTDVGYYSKDTNYFANSDHQNGVLTALANAEEGGNGVYQYGAGGFPSNSSHSSNYWVDVVFDQFKNPIVSENALQGNPASEWQVNGNGDLSIQGFATQISVNNGQRVDFKIQTDADDYRIDIYRLGYYGGAGARKVATINPSVTLPQIQNNCLFDASLGLADCGNWDVSASWQVPSTATSGIYIARPVRADTDGASHIVFVVRDDTGHSDILFQTSDTTWQAYNNYGGKNFYGAGRAYKLSYNRPFWTRTSSIKSWLFSAEYPMLRWLEKNGYDVSYFTGVDSHFRGHEILEHKLFLSVGHDEYWSREQRTYVESARNNGVSLGFFSGNEVFWKTRWDDERTLVCYKESIADGRIDDPFQPWTGTWRDNRFAIAGDEVVPENALTGTMFTVNAPRNDPILIPYQYSALRFWRNTAVAQLTEGELYSLPDGVLGYEWDSDVDNGYRPPGLIRVSETTLDVNSLAYDYGTKYDGQGPATHHLTLYRHASGALVFGAGTVQWSWGLDTVHDSEGTPTDLAMRQATVNLFADMAIDAHSLNNELQQTTLSIDSSPPSVDIDSPGGTQPINAIDPIVISGSAWDSGGGVVAAVEVSTDDGLTWHPAGGQQQLGQLQYEWQYTWQPTETGSQTILVRAIDDSLNIGTAEQVHINIDCPCSLWSASEVPDVPFHSDNNPVELGVKFRSSEGGFISGIRFYKGAGNIGNHSGSLWGADGTLLASALFGIESTSGWQTVYFPTPVAIQKDTTYIASYHTGFGYARELHGFLNTGINRGPLRALNDGEDGRNGLYRYGGTAFPTSSVGATNYWVDVIFDGE